MVAVNRDLSRAETLRRQIAAGELVELIDRKDETIDRVEVLLANLKGTSNNGDFGPSFLYRALHCRDSLAIIWSGGGKGT